LQRVRRFALDDALVEQPLDERKIAARAVDVFAQRLLDDLAGVNHAHRDVLDVFLCWRFDLLLGHRSPLRRCVGREW